MPNATITPAGIVFTAGVFPIVVGPTPRALYLYENDSIQPVTAGVGAAARSLYVYESDVIYDRIAAVGANGRSLYVYENDAIQPLLVSARALYLYESDKDLPVIPLLLLLDPDQQYPLGAVDVYGDGLGQYVNVAPGSTITAISTNGTHVPANVVAYVGTGTYWQSNNAGTAAWIRFTFASPQTIWAIALEDLVYSAEDSGVYSWGTPVFRFSDGGADVTGSTAVPIPRTDQPVYDYRDSEFPVGAVRTLYVLPTPRTGITWVEVRIAPATGSGGYVGLSSAWVYADQGQLAEASNPILNALSMGATGVWLNRSPNLWPANSGVPLAKAITVVVPSNGVSGLVKVQES